MASKTFKLGEVARGGVITVEATEKKITLISKEWDFSTGSRRGSNQSNARELYRLEVNPKDSDVQNKMYQWLAEESTSYWADKIIDWVKTKVKLATNYNW